MFDICQEEMDEKTEHIGVSKWTIVAICLGGVAVGVAVWFIPAETWCRVLNIVTAVGTYNSLVAFIVMLQQFKSVKETTINVKQEVNKIAAIADLSQYAERVRSVYGDICDKEYKLAVFKLQTVRDVVLSVKLKIEDPQKERSYSKTLSTIATTIATLQSVDVNPDCLNMSQIQKDMEKIVVFLQQEKTEVIK